ncbi:mannosyl-oligosaccharide 1,2-alpha-mannosidase [Coprinopsis cinerea AmutBmut pab1-1]|nr:mannosyl-oligosaccharide 1,2-alpha-mannosidase [Coprinopsis cinerea AmutBmut pab1-1]
MSGNIRTRKGQKGGRGSQGKESPKAQNKSAEANGHHARASEASSFPTGLVWIAALAGLLATAYLEPDIFVALFDAWIGFSDHNGVVQTSSNTQPEPISWLPADEPKRDAVVKAFKFAWGAYERDAMGSDEYHPLSKEGSNLGPDGGIGYMIIDVLDTLQIMGLQEEYARARDWIANSLDFNKRGSYSTFETTIRVLGGLLSAYHLSGNDPLFLEKAEDIGDRLLSAFEDSPSGFPLPYVNLLERQGYHTKDYPGTVSVAEIGTLQLEFKYLSHLTGNQDYWRVAEGVMERLKSSKLPHNLASVFLSYEEGRYLPSTISLGSRGDSYYEYLLKQFIQTNYTEHIYQEMYRDSMDGVDQYLIQRSPGNNLVHTSELWPEEDAEGQINEWRLTPKQDHLVCFLGGSLMLGAVKARARVEPVSRPPRQEELTEEGWRDWKTGLELIRTCMRTHETATGLSPEIVYFRVPSDGMDSYEFAPPDWYIRGAQPGVPPPYDARYMLRPETVESLFIAYRLTGDSLFREQGWQIFQAIEKHCRVETGGYATVLNVDQNPPELENKMETFFLSETLKYLYLLFSDSSVIPLDQYVFNTEAHPFPIIAGNT